MKWTTALVVAWFAGFGWQAQAQAQAVRQLAIANMVDIPQLLEVRDGLLSGLSCAEAVVASGEHFCAQFSASGNSYLQERVLDVIVEYGGLDGVHMTNVATVDGLEPDRYFKQVGQLTDCARS